MPQLPALRRELLRPPNFGRRHGLSMSADALTDLPEKAVQFGTGAFLRGFVEYFLDRSNADGSFGGRVVLVGSTGSGRDNVLNEQEGLYTLSIQGVREGLPGIEHELITCVSRALSAVEEWDAVLDCARNPALELIFSNTTEIGIVLDECDTPELRPPRSFPGKLTLFLYERARVFDFNSDAGVVVLPCELIEKNGSRLRDVVGTLAERWRLGSAFSSWLDSCVVFCDTLVDRIVTGAPAGDRADSLRAELGYIDDLLTVCEPYRLFAIEGDDSLRRRLPFAHQSGVIVAPDIAPFRERKVRLLNGTHTITVPVALLCGCSTVAEALEHEAVGAYMRTVLFDEIVPSLDVSGGDAFARELLDRFANPYIHHALTDITLHATMKMRVRVVPSIESFALRTGHVPQLLAFGFAAHIEFLRARAAGELDLRGMPPDDRGSAVMAIWMATGPAADVDPRKAVKGIASDTSLWGSDLDHIPGFTVAVSDHLTRIRSMGMLKALENHLAEAEMYQ